MYPFFWPWDLCSEHLPFLLCLVQYRIDVVDWNFFSTLKYCSSLQICSRIASQRAANPNFDKLYITKDSSCTGHADHLFMDIAVYSRNRCFRLAFSSKSGKKSFLVATERFKHKNMVRP